MGYFPKEVHIPLTVPHLIALYLIKVQSVDRTFNWEMLIGYSLLRVSHISQCLR